MDDLTIKRAELLQVAMDPVAPMTAAHGVVGQRPVILVRIWDADGTPGWGECVAFPKPGYLSETVDSAWTALRTGVIPAVLNRSFNSPDDLAKYLSAAMPQSPVAAATVEMAAWDLTARQQGRSLANLLGGTRTNVATGRTIGILEPSEDLSALVERAAGDGYRRIKIKIEPRRALGIAIEAVRAADTVPVIADANASFGTDDVQKLRELDAADLAWIEQPYSPASLRATADLRDSLRTRIALDESANTLNAIKRLIDMGAAHAISIKPGRLGGHSAARAAYRMARDAAMSLWIGGMLETGIGRAHNLALASLAGFDLPGDMGPSSVYWKRDILTEPFEMVAGHIPVPTGPGIGVTVDSDYLRLATLRREVF